MENENIACIEDSDIKYLHSGQLSKYVFAMDRTEAHKKKISHLIVRVFAIAFYKKKPLYLVQQRSKKKESFPGYYTDSASGHVLYKKNMSFNDIKADAKRELEEELGINSKLIKEMRFYDLRTEKNNGINEISYIFIVLFDEKIKLNPDQSEVSLEYSKFYSESELKEILDNKEAIDYSREIWKEIINKDLNEFFKDQINSFEKSNEIALFIGRFQPLHHGHIYVLKKLFQKYEKVKIGIGSSQISKKFTDPFTDTERKEFIKAALKKRNIASNRYKLYSIPDIFDAQRWVDHVMSIVDNFDIIYSNSDWVRQLFKNKNIKLGKKLTIFKKKYSGTRIRKLIANNEPNWKELIPKEVRDIMDKNNGIERITSLYRKDHG